MLNDARRICLKAIESCLPQEAVKKALDSLKIEDAYVVAVGKAAFSMAQAAAERIRIRKGIVITKYHHLKGEIENMECYEAGHPISDENTLKATEDVIRMVSDLKEDDRVVFLLSGGASALFEAPLIPLKELQKLNEEMLKKGLNISQINTIRKKLSKVKGGRFADLCAPAKVYSIILSDVLNDRLDVIGSGPTVRDPHSRQEALELIRRYELNVSEDTIEAIERSEEGKADNAVNMIVGSVRILCENAMKEAEKLGYKAILLDDQLDMDCNEAAVFLAEKIDEYRDCGIKTVLIAGGETTVVVRGNGLGGRSQQLALTLARHIRNEEGILVVCVGSDGTDGPTDAAGGYADGKTCERLERKGLDIDEILEDNDAYHGLEAIDSLIVTGPTGTNVNDLVVILIDR